MSVTLPPFPVDDSTLELLLSATSATGDSDCSSVRDLCRMYSEMAGSDLRAGESDGDYVFEVRDPVYHHNDVIAALVRELLSLRQG